VLRRDPIRVALSFACVENRARRTRLQRFCLGAHSKMKVVFTNTQISIENRFHFQ